MEQLQVLFSTKAIQSFNIRFSSSDKISVFESSDLASVALMSSLILNPTCEHSGSRTDSKLFSATVNDKHPSLVRYIDVTPNVENQADTLVYLSLLKTLRHSHLEEASVIGLIELGSGRSRETKVEFGRKRATLPKKYLNVAFQVVIVSEQGSESKPLETHLEQRPSTHADWRMRVKIALDISRGLEHLHRNSIVHGDIRASNVFVRFDTDWEAKLGVFFRALRGQSSELMDDILALGLLMVEMVLGTTSMPQVYGDSLVKRSVKRGAVNETKLRKLIPFECPEGFEVKSVTFSLSFTL